jgi:hypothetical protein
MTTVQTCRTHEYVAPDHNWRLFGRTRFSMLIAFILGGLSGHCCCCRHDAIFANGDNGQNRTWWPLLPRRKATGAPVVGPFGRTRLGTMISMPWAWPLHVGTTATWPNWVVSTWAAAVGQGTLDGGTEHRTGRGRLEEDRLGQCRCRSRKHCSS